MMRPFVVMLLLAGPLPHFMPGRVTGADSPLKAALMQFRGMHTERAYVWTWEKRAIIVTQFPLSKEYHVQAGVQLKWSPWRDLAAVPPESLPSDQELQRVAREADYLVITEAPDAAECVVNIVAGNEIRAKYGLDQLGRSEVLTCTEASARSAKFGASPEFVDQISDVLKHALPWNPAFDDIVHRRDAGVGP